MRAQRGLSIIEVLVSIVILAVVGLATANNTIKGFVFFKRNMRQAYASQLALDKIEALATVDPTTLTSASSTTETNLTYQNVVFTRQTTITVNADNSRTALVQVTGHGFGGKAMYSANFPVRGNS